MDPKEERAGKTDVIEQRLPAPIQPSQAQKDKRFELSRDTLAAGERRTYTYRVQPDSYLVINQGAAGSDLTVSLGPLVQPDHVVLDGGQHVRLAGVDPQITLYSVAGTVAVVMAEAGYPVIAFGV